MSEVNEKILINVASNFSGQCFTFLQYKQIITSKSK